MWSPLSNTLRLKEGIGTGSNGAIVSWSGSTTRTIQNVTYSSDNAISGSDALKRYLEKEV